MSVNKTLSSDEYKAIAEKLDNVESADEGFDRVKKVFILIIDIYLFLCSLVFFTKISVPIFSNLAWQF